MAEKYDLYSHKNIVVRIFREHWLRFKEFHPEYFHDPSLLNALTEVGVKTVKEVASLGSHNAEIEIGIIGVIQTAARASTWNPHLHLLVTEGRLDKKGNWHNGIYLEYETLRKNWMYNLLTMLKERMASRRDALEKIEEVYQKRKDKGFIVRAKKERIRKKDIVGYLIKYVASPPIALSRIEEYDGRR